MAINTTVTAPPVLASRIPDSDGDGIGYRVDPGLAGDGILNGRGWNPDGEGKAGGDDDEDGS